MRAGFAEVSIDEVRNYWDKRPCNIRHSPLPIGTAAYFDQVEARKYFVEPHIPGFAEFERWSGKSVLEIGCGLGTDTMNFARAGAHVTAVDVSAASVDLARKRAEIFGLSDHIDFYVANAEDLANHIPAKKYDLVYSFGVIHHSPHPEKIIEQVRANFLHNGSKLKLMVYNRYSWKVLGMLFKERGKFWKLDDIIAKHSEAQTGCPITYSYSMKSIGDLLGSSFEIEDAFVEHIFPYRISKYVMHEYEKEWYFKFVPASMFRTLERRFGWHLCVTAKLVG